MIDSNKITLDLQHSTQEGEVARIYNLLNRSGYGYSVGEDGDAVTALDCGKFICQTADGIAVYETAEGYILVGDAHGPWAVDVKKA